MADELGLHAEFGRLSHDEPALRIISIDHGNRRLLRTDAGDLRAEVAAALLDYFLRRDSAAELLELFDEPLELGDCVLRRVLAVAVFELDGAPIDAALCVNLLFAQFCAALEIGAVVGGRSCHRQDDSNLIRLALRRLCAGGCCSCERT